jgi:tubulin delta
MFDGYEKSAALVSNSQSPVKLLDHVVGKAWTMFGSRAYVNQYLRHGMEEENFLDCFASLEQIIANYKHLSSL